MAIALVRRTMVCAAVAFAAVAAGSIQPPQQAAAPPIVEEQIKAQFLLNFLHFIDWPETAFASPDAPLRLCLVGDGPVDRAIRLFAGERVDNRRVVIEVLKREEDARTCRLIFVPNGQRIRLPVLVKQAARHGVLIVTESAETLRSSCAAVALVSVEGRIRFDINLAALRHHGLTASSKLLHVARDRVDEPDRCPGS